MDSDCRPQRHCRTHQWHCSQCHGWSLLPVCRLQGRGPPPRHQHTIHTSFYKYGGSHMTPHQINSIFTHRTHVTLHMEKRRILWNIYSEWRHGDGAIVKVKGGNTVNSHVCFIQQYACYQHETWLNVDEFQSLKLRWSVHCVVHNLHAESTFSDLDLWCESGLKCVMLCTQ